MNGATQRCLLVLTSWELGANSGRRTALPAALSTPGLRQSVLADWGQCTLRPSIHTVLSELARVSNDGAPPTRDGAGKHGDLPGLPHSPAGTHAQGLGGGSLGLSDSGHAIPYARGPWEPSLICSKKANWDISCCRCCDVLTCHPQRIKNLLFAAENAL